MFVSHVLSIAVVSTAVALPPSVDPRQTDADSLREHKAVSRFLRAVDEYAVVHRLVDPLDPNAMCLPDETLAAVNWLAAVPLDDRATPREGDIFLPGVVDLFRARIVRTLRHYEFNPTDLVATMNAEELSARPITVGQPLPWGGGKRTFDWLFAALPVLPEDLEYRLAAGHLVLVDLRANIVVDVLRGVVPMY
jgi:hypothetical protein